MATVTPHEEFVVRHAGQWFLAPVGTADPQSVDFDEVRRTIAGGDGADPVPATVLSGHAVIELTGDAIVRPPWILIGRVVGDGVVVDDLAGGHVLLDVVDLDLIDRLTDAGTAGALIPADLDTDEGLARLGRLAGAGCLRAEPVVEEPLVDEEPVAISAPAPVAGPSPWQRAVGAYRLSSKLAPVRRLFGEPGAPTPVRSTPAAEGLAAMNGSAPAAAPVPDTSVDGTDADADSGDDAPRVELLDRTRGLGDPEDGRIHVYPVWHTHVGPLLALGMLSAAARHWKDGALNEHFYIHRPLTAEEFLEDLARRDGPAVMLSSDYVWSLEANLDVARRGLAINEQLVVVHGGPSAPKYEGDGERFFDDHGSIAHVLTRSEGEVTICEILESFAGSLPELDATSLGAIEGISFRDPDTGTTVRTEDRGRNAELDELPSPYLTGEFDHIPASAWNYCMAVETNRGCPYGCTFCDWGSSTLSRIRKFDIDRVTEEFRWAAARGVQALNIPDANFGIMSRDVQTAQRLADIKKESGFPNVLVFYPAKNTTKHLAKIMDILGDARISSAASLSLQSTDAETLDALDRNNISTDHFVALAADYRRRGHPLQGDLLLGMPAQTYDTYRDDLQFMMDHEILARTWPVQILPNAPMNAPEYREKYGIVSDDQNLITTTSSFDEDDRAKMLRYRRIELTAERYGVLRHVLRWMQWDKGHRAADVLDHLLDLVDHDPHRFPHLTWLFSYFDLFPAAPAGWSSVYREVRQLLAEDYGLVEGSDLECVLAVQEFLMPSPGRSFPASLPLAHDYVAYYRSAAESLFTDGHASGPSAPLAEFGPSVLTVEGDPLGLCETGVGLEGDSRSETMQGDFYIGSSVAHELLSPLIRHLPYVDAVGIPPAYTGPEGYEPEHAEDPEIRAVAEDEPDPSAGIPVELSSRA